MWKTIIGDFDWNTKTGVEASDDDTESDLIHYQTGNGLRHASGPVRLPLSTRYINYVLFLLQYFPIYQNLPHDLPKNGITEVFSDLLEILDKQMREQNYSSALVSCTKVYHTLRKLGVRVPHTAYAKLTFQLHTVSLGLYAAWGHT